ncbi:endoplasmic reticulum metallopeptidase, partial [Trifolium medium]|nr:endoplasmic reticulum metallopeptidase [Trifolium medium]
MRKRRETASVASKGSNSGADASEEKSSNDGEIRTVVSVGNSKRSSISWLA